MLKVGAMLTTLLVFGLVQFQDQMPRDPVKPQRDKRIRKIEPPKIVPPPPPLAPSIIHWKTRPPRYDIREINVGPNVSEPLRPVAINNRGDIVGTCGTSSILVESKGPAWVLEFGKVHAMTLDESRQIGALLPSEFDGPSVPIRWTKEVGPSRMAVPKEIFPTYIAPNGDWLGAMQQGRTTIRHFRDHEEALKPLRGYELSGGGSMTTQGWVVGGSYRISGVDRALTLWKNPSSPRRLPLPKGFRYFDHMFIAHDGTVAGICWQHEVGPGNAPQGVFAFVSKDGKSSLIPFDRAVSRSEVRGISDSGDIIGEAAARNERTGQSDNLMWLYRKGRTYFLNELLPRSTPWDPGQAYCINNRGEIAGTAGYAGTFLKGFVMSPQMGEEK